MKVQIPELKREIKIVSAQAKPIVPHVYLDPDCPIVRINSPYAVRYDYEACPSINAALEDEEHPNKIVVGPFGTGKTTRFVQRILTRAVTMPMCDDGVRRYKCILERNTTGDLESTLLQTWLDWSTGLPPPIGRENNKIKQNPEYNYQIYDEFGLIDFRLFFLALDRPDSGRKLDSLETTDAFIGEVRHMAKCHFQKTIARIGRYPKKIMFNKLWDNYRVDNKITNDEKSEEYKDEYKKWFPYQPQIWGDTNPPPEHHWVVDIELGKGDPFELEDKSIKIAPIKVYHQPPAILKNASGKWENNPNADNVKYQSPTYWLEMLDNGIEYAKVYAQGYYGLAKEGEVVFPQFNQDIHVVSGLEAIKDVPILLTFDISLNALSPACLISQLAPNGQFRALKEFCADRASNRELSEDVVLPYLERHYKGFELLQPVRDPASEAGKDVKDLELQTGKVLDSIFGIKSIAAKTNIIKQRLEAVKFYLTRLVEGKPAFVVSKEGCPILIEAFLAKYIYVLKKIIGDPVHHDTPSKTHPHSDIMDCCQYACCEFGGSGIRQNSKKAYNINYKQFLAHNTVM